MSDVLETIAARTRERVAELRRREPLSELQGRASSSRRPHDFRDVFLTPGTHVIAEVKLASPSEGDIAPGMDPVLVAADYLRNGAAALSVLTEPYYFKGSTQYLQDIRAQFPQARILMKDFLVDEYQLFLARAIGADAVLILLAMLDEEQAKTLVAGARALGLAPLVEVHTAAELGLAAALKADLIGVNNRDLKTMKVSLGISRELSGRAPPECVLISESGIRTAEDLSALRDLGYRGFLIGTRFMKSGRPGAALRELLQVDR